MNLSDLCRFCQFVKAEPNHVTMNKLHKIIIFIDTSISWDLLHLQFHMKIPVAVGISYFQFNDPSICIFVQFSSNYDRKHTTTDKFIETFYYLPYIDRRFFLKQEFSQNQHFQFYIWFEVKYKGEPTTKQSTSNALHLFSNLKLILLQ